MEPDKRNSTKIIDHRFVRFQFIPVMWMSLLSMVVIVNTDAWSFHDVPARHSKTCCSSENNPVLDTRRDFVAIAFALSGAGPLLLDAKIADAAEDAVDQKQRFVAARNELRELIDNYPDIITKGGGDAVRNRLGTQGVNSNLFGIQKLLKTLTADADDIVEYTETMEEFNAYYFQADGVAYQSMFVEHSSAKGTPESLLKTAKVDILQMEKYMDQLAAQLKL